MKKVYKAPVSTQTTSVRNKTDRLQGGTPANQNSPGTSAGGKVVSLELSRITLDAKLQCRATVNATTIRDYAERMRAGDQFPPMVVFEVEDQYLLADGWQRHPAALKAGFTEFPVQIRQGTWKDALRFALQANATHGLPRTNKDKRRAVEIALKEFRKDSDRAIADLCKVSHVFVGKVRQQLVTVTSSEARVGQDGKKRKLPQKKLSSGSHSEDGEHKQSADTSAPSESAKPRQTAKPHSAAGSATKSTTSQQAEQEEGPATDYSTFIPCCVQASQNLVKMLDIIDEHHEAMLTDSEARDAIRRVRGDFGRLFGLLKAVGLEPATDPRK